MAEGDCGVVGHPDGCYCDVDLDVHGRVPVNAMAWFNGALGRVGVNPEDDPEGYWDRVYSLVEARAALRRRQRLGLHGYHHETYSEKAKIVKAFMQEPGRSMVPLVGNDTACFINLGPELPWFEVCATLTGHATRGDSPIWRWNAPEWRLFESELSAPTMSMRALARSLHCSHSTIQRLRAWYREPT